QGVPIGDHWDADWVSSFALSQPPEPDGISKVVVSRFTARLAGALNERVEARFLVLNRLRDWQSMGSEERELALWSQMGVVNAGLAQVYSVPEDPHAHCKVVVEALPPPANRGEGTGLPSYRLCDDGRNRGCINRRITALSSSRRTRAFSLLRARSKG